MPLHRPAFSPVKRAEARAPRTKQPTTFILILALAILTTLASAHAQTPGEQFQSAVAAFQKSATEDNARKLAELLKQLDPPPAIPDDAKLHALKGAAFVKQTKSETDRAAYPALFAKAAAEYQAASAAAPWVGEYYFNRAACEKSAGQFAAATAALKLDLIFARTEQDRDANLALRADIETTQEIAATRKSAAEKAAVTKKAKADKLARADEEKRQAVQAKLDVISQIKKIVAGRNYSRGLLSYRKESEHVFDGVNENELFGGGTFYIHAEGPASAYWKFFDDHVEVWLPSNNEQQFLQYVGVPSGPQLKDMHWFQSNDNKTKTEFEMWGYFDPSNGRFYVSVQNTSHAAGRPLDNTKLDPAKRYMIYLYKP